eukprot:gb/GFBE01023643.1/.p1 GENE.gb/GFBE01023643.1/~~gb/GFBE01023643.1/.p1  ORF type:complete len:243 (+),score=40.74 gb/GFBE01023643.1/:1-729(+)
MAESDDELIAYGGSDSAALANDSELVQVNDSTTTLALRGLRKTCTSKCLVDLLARICPSEAYNFVHIDWDSWNGIVNFVNHECFQVCFSQLGDLCDRDELQEFGFPSVHAAPVQGLVENLLIFLATHGLASVDHPRAPLVFEDGVQVALKPVINAHVPVVALLQKEDEMKKCRGRRKFRSRAMQSRSSALEPLREESEFLDADGDEQTASALAAIREAYDVLVEGDDYDEEDVSRDHVPDCI